MTKKVSHEQQWRDLAFTSHDGLRLAARHYPAHPRPGVDKKTAPLLCLSTLAGNSGEFHALALHLSKHAAHPRDVYCPDYRGHGQSERDRDPGNYTPFRELRDILDFLTIYDLSRVHLLGSSRGGINAMLLATTRPGALKSVILNDLGPALEASGIARLLGQLATAPKPRDWPDAIALMRTMNETHYPALTNEDWQAMASWHYRETKRRLVPSHDPKLTRAARSFNLGKALPDMWRQYLALFNHPLLIIRGEHSDMLSHKTVERMRTLHWRAKTVTVPGQGHPPLLRDSLSHATIEQFLLEAEHAQKPQKHMTH